MALYNEHSALQEKQKNISRKLSKRKLLAALSGKQNKNVLRDRLKNELDTASLTSQGSWFHIPDIINLEAPFVDQSPNNISTSKWRSL